MKKVISLVMVMALVMCLMAGCGSNTESATTATEAPADTETAADTETEAPAEGGSFYIGGIGPITGDNAIYGLAVMNGAQIAVDEINAAGGINGYTVEYKFEDDVADGETAVNAYNNLMDWGMQVLVGPTTTGSAISVSAKVYEERVFALTPSASSPDVTAGKDNMFQLCFTDPNQGSGSAVYMGANMPEAKVAVIYRNDDAYSQGIRDTFVAEAANQAAGADTVFLPIYYQPASVIMAQANAMGYAPTFFGVDGMDGILTLDGFDTSLAEGVMVLTPFSATAEDELTQNFVAEYNERYGETPNQFAADGYDCVYAIKQAMENAGCTPDMSAEEICDAMVEQFTSMSFSGLTGTDMTWSTAGEVSKMPVAVVIENGVYVTAE